jgi:zinc D-Ala-D-Ala carboxypeptidase
VDCCSVDPERLKSEGFSSLRFFADWLFCHVYTSFIHCSGVISVRKILIKSQRLRFSKRLHFIAITLVTTAIVVGLGILLKFQPGSEVISSSPNSDPSSTVTYYSSTTEADSVEQAQPSAIPKALPSVAPIAPSAPAEQQGLRSPTAPIAAVKVSPLAKPYFGHLPYEEGDRSRLVDAGRFVRGTYERSEVLDFEANEAFQQMVAAAKAEGISLMPISGFRTIADQKVLYEKQIARKGSEEAAAKWSAPPGYSEHHTGYALDIGDANSDTDIKMTFQDTDAYRWLVVNANNFGFQQSFPLNNHQGVSFEPWHWRYVGSPRASAIFAAARGSVDLQ